MKLSDESKKKKELISCFQKIKVPISKNIEELFNSSSVSIQNFTTKLNQMSENNKRLSKIKTFDVNKWKRSSNKKPFSNTMLFNRKYNRLSQSQANISCLSIKDEHKILKSSIVDKKHIKKIKKIYPISLKKPIENKTIDLNSSVIQSRNHFRTLSEVSLKSVSMKRMHDKHIKSIKAQLSDMTTKTQDIKKELSRSFLYNKNEKKYLKKIENKCSDSVIKKSFRSLKRDISDRKNKKQIQSFVRKSRVGDHNNLALMNKTHADIINFGDSCINYDDIQFYVRRKEILRSYPLIDKYQKQKENDKQEEEKIINIRENNLRKNSNFIHYLVKIVNKDVFEYKEKVSEYINRF